MFNKLIENIVTSLTKNKGTKDANLAHKLIYFGVYIITIFHGAKIGVTTQLMQKHAPYLSGVHYMAHCTNITVATLHSLKLVSKVEIFWLECTILLHITLNDVWSFASWSKF
jgi:hypothetical protein